MKSIEELALKEWSNLGYPVTADGIVKLCERVLAAYSGQQEPVGEVDGFGFVWWNDRLPQGITLYSVPVVPADMVLVPREPTEAMIRASWDCAGLTSPADEQRKLIGIAWHAMIAAGEKKS
jgi:hypothetical protein